MERLRSPLQGIKNIIRFNWHLYVVALFAAIALLAIGLFFPGVVRLSTYLLCGLLIFSTAVSLMVSFYVYDRSRLYEFAWLNTITSGAEKSVINIHAGFDETSKILQTKLPHASLNVFDFYDPLKHTEVSILRARAAYAPFPETQRITTSHLPVENNSVDLVFLIFAAHEIRDDDERISFFLELHKKLTPAGKIIILEHLRDLRNFLAYNIGFFHFHSAKTWTKTFHRSGLNVKRTKKINPFVSLFILEKE